MNRKNLIVMIAGCAAVLLLVCILMVGVLDNIWPWDGIDAYGRLITSQYQNSAGPRETTEATEATESTEAAGGNSQNNENNNQGSQGPVIGETSQAGTPPTLPKEENADVSIDIDGATLPSEGNTGSTGSTENTESTGSTESTEEDKVIEPSTPTTAPDYDAGFSYADFPKPPEN